MPICCDYSSLSSLLTSPFYPKPYPDDTTTVPPTTTKMKYKECGDNFTTAHGFLTSPSYPENYPNGADCIYIISQPNGTYINVTIVDVDLEFDDLWYECHDYMEIRDGESEESELLIQFCGNETVNNLNETSIISSRNEVWMK